MNVSWIKDHLGTNLFVALCLISLVTSVKNIDKEYGWVGVVVSFLSLIIISLRSRQRNDISSKEWFKYILRLLPDCADAKIYLREFKHPDEFGERHRDELMQLMEIFALKIVESPDRFHIISYLPHNNSKNPIDWLRSEISSKHGVEDADNLLKKCITIINKQPAANSSTVYMIDESNLLYNHIIHDKKMKYFNANLSRSIIPFFYNKGFSAFLD